CRARIPEKIRARCGRVIPSRFDPNRLILVVWSGGYFTNEEADQVANLGFVGLGVMGSRMAERLLQRGHSLTGYNRTKAKAQFLIDQGMKWADSPRAVAAAADVVFSSVTNSAALVSITEGPDGILAGLSKGKVYVDMSTVSVSTSRNIAAKVREKGADMMDSPVSGTVATLM